MPIKTRFVARARSGWLSPSTCAVAALAVLVVVAAFDVPVQVQGNKTLTTEEDFR
jgi:hypothetical protein